MSRKTPLRGYQVQDRKQSAENHLHYSDSKSLNRSLSKGVIHRGSVETRKGS